MRKRDTADVATSLVAVLADAGAVFAGFMLATWIRFDSGWIRLVHDRPADVYATYAAGAGVAALLFLFVFRSRQLFVRPQTGSFADKIPRLVKAVGLGVALSVVLAFTLQNEADFSRVTVGISFFTIGFFVLLERYILFRIEWNLARHSRRTRRVLILGTDSVAAHLTRTLKREPMLRSQVAGYVHLGDEGEHEAHPDVPPDRIRGSLEDLESLIRELSVDQVILTTARLGHRRTLDLILLCERNLVAFNMVPDLFRIMTGSMDVHSLDDIPLLGLRRWPLDLFWNRLLKRAEDIVGAVAGLLLTGPLIGVAAVLVKRSSPGPAFLGQERCGENGAPFTIYKLRTMRVDAEARSGPVFAAEDDPRTTPVGAFLRRHNIDELPQLWNVLQGRMSLVGPRPERPHFVEQFKHGIERYMWRHVSKPGLTGWAQVSGLRGNTSIEDRIRYDLYYLEHWSLAFDFKILAKSVFARENAY